MLERCCEERKTYADFLNTVVTANIHLYSDIGSVLVLQKVASEGS